jgi:hypothetical protein
MTCKQIVFTLLAAATLGACGNYSNEDLEYLNAVPAAQDITAEIPRAIMPANEAELARLTHDTVNVFNGSLDFLKAADVIRTYPPTSRIANGRIWGPIPMDDHPGWQWRFVVTRSPEAPDRFAYAFEVQRVGANADDWAGFIKGWFVAVNGVRKGNGHFEMVTNELMAANFPLERNVLKDEMLKELKVDYSTETFPTNVSMSLTVYTNVSLGLFDTFFTIEITYEAQESGQGAIEFEASDSNGNSFLVVSRWLASGRGRADETVTAGPLVGLPVEQRTRTQCWNDSFVEVYDHTPWDPQNMDLNSGDPSLCPEITTL